MQRYPLFLFTIPLFIIIHIEQQYHQLINYQFVYGPILWLFVPPVIVMLVSGLLFRNLGKAGIFSCALLLIYYFFSDLKVWLHVKAPDSFFASYTFLLPLVVLLLTAVFVVLKKSISSFQRTTLFINLAFILFIAADILLLLVDPSARNKDRGDQQKTISRNYIPCDTCSAKPDIYYLLFDAYTSSATLQSTFNYTNQLDSFLREKKFFIANRSRSNYNLTPFSISSCFNLQYLPRLNPAVDFYMDNYMPGIYSVYKSELPLMLEKEGYTIINHSIFELEKHAAVVPPYNSWNIDNLYSYHNIFRSMNADIGWLIRKKIPLPHWLDADIDYTELRNGFLAKTLTHLRQTIDTPVAGPRFVYAHFILPHAPYSFDSSGNQLPPADHTLSIPEKQVGYVKQVGYANKIIKNLVQDIFAHGSRPLVIIIQGDHGFRFGEGPRKNLEFPNLNAMYFSNGDYRLLNDSMTNINTFRVVLNTFFHQKFPLLKDTSYFLKYQ